MSHVESTSQTLLAGPTLSMPEHRQQNDEKGLHQRSALIQNPHRKLTAQCHRTEMEVIMKESFVKKNLKNHTYICHLLQDGDMCSSFRRLLRQHKTQHGSTSGRQRELFRRLK